MRLDTRTILIALAILNVLAIGMSEIQRRALIEHTLSSQADFRSEASQWSDRQADLLKRTSAQLAEIITRINKIEIQTSELSIDSARIADIAARVNKIEIQAAGAADASKQIQDIYERVQDVQKRLDQSK